LLEVLVAMTIFMVVTGSIWGVMRVALASRNVVNNNASNAKSVRLAINLIGRDTYNAGYGYPLGNTVVLADNKISAATGLPNDFDTTRDIVPPILAGNNINPDNWNLTANTRTDQITFFYKDKTFNVIGTGAAAISTPLMINSPTTTSSGIDQTVPISGSNSACAVNDLYLISGNSGSTLGVVTALSGTNAVQFGNGDPLGINLSGTSGTIRQITLPATMQKVVMVTYLVLADGTLVRREYVNRPLTTPVVAYVDEPLVYNVEDFQIQYIMDDGTVSDNPSAGPDGIAGTADDAQANLAAIRQVRYTVSVRSTEKRADGSYYRESMTSTFSTRNLGYDAS